MESWRIQGFSVKDCVLNCGISALSRSKSFNRESLKAENALKGISDVNSYKLSELSKLGFGLFECIAFLVLQKPENALLKKIYKT